MSLINFFAIKTDDLYQSSFSLTLETSLPANNCSTSVNEVSAST
jgi:hypothetical protein